MKPTCLIVSPALAAANNGNWHTARRWQYYSNTLCNTSLALSYAAKLSFDVAIALHAFRSADSIKRLCQAKIPTAVVLTGTDLYKDINSEPKAIESLELADYLVVLNEQGLEQLPKRFRTKARCIFQSARTRQALASRKTSFDFAFVGHIRAVKDPVTPLKALQMLKQSNACLRIAGAEHVSHDGVYEKVMALACQDSRVQLLGGVSQTRARQLIAQSRALIISSEMEGGANVLIEAITSSVPVLASKVPGNIGMLGKDYPGYFPFGDYRALAALMERCIEDPQFLTRLRTACSQRSHLFHPKMERLGVQNLIADCLALK